MAEAVPVRAPALVVPVLDLVLDLALDLARGRAVPAVPAVLRVPAGQAPGQAQDPAVPVPAPAARVPAPEAPVSTPRDLTLLHQDYHMADTMAVPPCHSPPAP